MLPRRRPPEELPPEATGRSLELYTAPTMSDDGPPLIRPIPRRPFDVNLTTPTPPDEDSTPPSPNPAADLHRLLDPRFNAPPGASEGGSLSRAQSIMNLTRSTLFGIYSPTTSSSDRWSYYNDGQEPDTPWGTGAETPAKRESLDEGTYELMKDRSTLLRRRSSARVNQVVPSPPQSTTSFILSVAMRAALLFGLGMGYGVLVSQLHDEQNIASLPAEGLVNPGYNWRYLTFWGVCGVVLGGLLPWFDGLWEQTFEKASLEDEEIESKNVKADTDWALVIRGIGAFAGIVFAIRKLPWASTMQVSLTLALVNPFLWYLIDRSKPGFLLSAAVGLTGSAILMGLNPQIVPTPAGFSSDGLHRNGTAPSFAEPLTLGGLASQETVETGIWMLSVLFCSCVCFGNIGRRLALTSSATTRGRWGGVR